MAVHDRLGQAGGAARIDDPERMVEGKPARRQRRRRRDQRIEVVRGASGRSEPLRVGTRVEVAPKHDVTQGRQVGQQLDKHRHPVVCNAAVRIAVAGEEQHGLDLAEAVEHGERPHVGRAHRPHRAEAGAGEKGDRRLRHVRHEGSDAIAGRDAQLGELGRQRADLAAQLGPGDLQRLAAQLHAPRCERRSPDGLPRHCVRRGAADAARS